MKPIQVTGKGNRPVLILLTDDLQTAMSVLLETENSVLFPQETSTSLPYQISTTLGCNSTRCSSVLDGWHAWERRICSPLLECGNISAQWHRLFIYCLSKCYLFFLYIILCLPKTYFSHTQIYLNLRVRYAASNHIHSAETKRKSEQLKAGFKPSFD